MYSTCVCVCTLKEEDFGYYQKSFKLSQEGVCYYTAWPQLLTPTLPVLTLINLVMAKLTLTTLPALKLCCVYLIQCSLYLNIVGVYGVVHILHVSLL